VTGSGRDGNANPTELSTSNVLLWLLDSSVSSRRASGGYGSDRPGFVPTGFFYIPVLLASGPVTVVGVFRCGRVSIPGSSITSKHTGPLVVPLFARAMSESFY
jgi:hypothetical protein